MPLVPAKCPSCGADVQIDDSRKEAFCSFCGSKFLVESAVNYYNTNNEYHIEQANIQVEDRNGLEARLKNAESYLSQHKQYLKALPMFESITKEFGGDWRGWWGMARGLTYDFSAIMVTRAEGDHFTFNLDFRQSEAQFRQGLTAHLNYWTATARYHANNAFNVMDPDMLAKCRPVWEAYEQKRDALISSLVDKLAKVFVNGKADHYKTVEQKKQLEAELKKEKGKLFRSSKRENELLAQIKALEGLPIMREVVPILGEQQFINFNGI